VDTVGGWAKPAADGTLLVSGLDLTQVGDLAFDNGVRIHELSPLQASLEQAFMELTKDSVEFHATVPAAQLASADGKVEAGS
jgi:ABC-2 type transport system ATP-binding protein